MSAMDHANKMSHTQEYPKNILETIALGVDIKIRTDASINVNNFQFFKVDFPADNKMQKIEII